METVIAALIGLVAGVLSGMLSGWAVKRKNDADASEAISKAVKNIMDSLNVRFEDLGKENSALKKELTEIKSTLAQYKKGIQRLIDQIRCSGLAPVWSPEVEESGRAPASM